MITPRTRVSLCLEVLFEFDLRGKFEGIIVGGN